jgi:tripartite-type tricarboxylate transporter receptor subunit TctC
MKRMIRSVCCVVIAAVFTQVSSLAVAQEVFPSKPIRMLVGFPPGGFTDLAARMIAQGLSDSLGVQVVVDNRPGANGSIAAMLTARASPDGYTFYMASPGHTTNPILQSQTRYDPIKDFTPISGFADIPNVLVVSLGLPAHSVQEFLALAKSRSVPLTQATTGIGAPGHLIGELLQIMAKVKFTHVPYKGSGPIMPDLATGRVDFTFSSAASALPHVRSARIRALGVSGSKRTAAYPEVPTISEAGVPGFEAVGRYALFGPAQMPKAVVDKLSMEITKYLQRSEVQVQLSKVGAEPVEGGAQELVSFVLADYKKWLKVIKTAKIAGE